MGNEQLEILTLCTGNAARSVMAGYMFEHLAAVRGLPLVVATAGTLAVDGQPMSMRTRDALATIPELAHAPVGAHRSRGLVERHVERADLVVAMEADHVRFVRRRHPAAAGRTATLRRLCAGLPAGPEPLAVRLEAMKLATAELADDEDVADPAGGDQAAYDACAAELWALCRELADRL